MIDNSTPLRRARNNHRNLVGQRFGKLTVIERAACDGHGRSRWIAVCDCGSEPRDYDQYTLLSKHSASCGCTIVPSHTTHGWIRDCPSEYKAWWSLIRRCTDPEDEGYHRYGGRGISVCDRWLGEHGVAQFIADMGLRPGRGYSIERKNNNGNYEPTNCVWATAKQQANNRRTTVFVTIDGISRPASYYYERIGLTARAFHMRRYHGWSDEKAATTQPRVKRGNQ